MDMENVNLKNATELLRKMKNDGFKKVTINIPCIGDLTFNSDDINYLMIDGTFFKQDKIELFIEGTSNQGHVYFKSTDHDIKDIKISVEF